FQRQKSASSSSRLIKPPARPGSFGASSCLCSALRDVARGGCLARSDTHVSDDAVRLPVGSRATCPRCASMAQKPFGGTKRQIVWPASTPAWGVHQGWSQSGEVLPGVASRDG